jgi:hypothetical protein
MLAIIFLIVSVLLIVFVILLLVSVRKKLIVRFDENGLTTKADKYYRWVDLQEIRYRMVSAV